jgi:hypothetical protein
MSFCLKISGMLIKVLEMVKNVLTGHRADGNIDKRSEMTAVARRSRFSFNFKTGHREKDLEKVKKVLDRTADE